MLYIYIYMSTGNQNNTIYIVCGQTTTGKSNLAVELALQHDGEVVSTDSRQIYAGLDIGSNKITEREMCGVVHHGLDIVQPEQRFTVADFQVYTRASILNIHSRGKTAILCGGTGLYIDAVMFDHYTFGGARATPAVWRVWDGFKNCSIHWIGLHSERDVLYKRIYRRAEVKSELVFDEVRTLLLAGVSRNWLYTLGLEYTLAVDYIESLISHTKYVELLTQKTLQYAKRQKTWFKRNTSIHWKTID